MKKILLTALAFTCLSSMAQTKAALNFNGTNNYVPTVSTGTLSFTESDNYTLEAWINPSGFNGLAGIISKYQNWGSNGYTLRLSGTAPYTGINFDGYQTAPGVLTAGTWYHIAAVNNGGTRTLYVNGVLVSLSNIGHVAVQANSDSLMLGVDYKTSGRYFKGTIDEVRIWNVARSQSQVQTDMCSTTSSVPGLLVYYNFNNGIPNGNNTSITNVPDVTGNGYNGTLVHFALTGTTSNFVNDVLPVAINPASVTIISAESTTLTASGASSYTWSTLATTNSIVVAPMMTTVYTVTGTNAQGCTATATSTLAVNGAALNFNGSANYINATNATVFSFTETGHYTLEAWINPSGFNGLAGIISKYQSFGTNGYTLRLSGTAPYTGINFDGYQTAPGVLTAGTWYHIAAVNNGGTRTLYVNGMAVSLTNAGHVSVQANNDVLTLGVDYLSSGRYFNGTIDEVRIWNRALCATEIQNSMNAELRMPQTGLVAYYPFNEGLAGISNTTVTVAADSSGNGYNGSLTNFTLNGTTSNWVAPGAVTTGSYAPAYVAPTIVVSGNTSFCVGGTTTLTAGNNVNTYTWTPAASTASITVSPTVTTSYSVVGTTSVGCVSKVTVTTVTVNALPNVTAMATSTAICTGNSDSLRATGAVSYAWNTSATSANISVSPTAATSYTVTGTDANGCVNTATVAVNVNALPTLSLTASSPSVCVNGTPITLTGSPAGGVYSGTHVSGNTFTPTAATGTFNVVYSYTNSTTSCSNKDSVALVVDACTGIARYAQNNLSVYPNPASNQVTVQASSELGTVTVYNAIGQVVEVLQVKDTQTQLNVSAYASGIYTILTQGTYIKFIKD
ncbi:MAG: T9SS type A sorting domain-containing protein [Bacteroidetes bacterium]|nr:T9SS type A sorting domain-containing protein [Bacteroidota bacterium]